MNESIVELSNRNAWHGFKLRYQPKVIRKTDDYDFSQKNEQLRNVLKNINEGIIFINSQLRLVYINEYAKLLVQLATLDNLIGKEISYVFQVKSFMYQQLLKAHVNQVPVHIEYNLNKRQFVEMDIFPHKEGLMVYLRDMTHRKTREGCQQHEYQAVINGLDKIAEGFYALDSSWRFIYLNKGAGDFFSQAPGRLIGKELWREFPELRETDIELKFKESLGAQISQSFETKGLTQGKWYLQQVFPSQNGLTVYVNDISERKRLEMEIARLDRLNTVGEMAASIGHEIRNPMTTVRGFLQILGDKEECVNFKESFSLMIEELDRCNSIITEFLSFAGKRETGVAWCNLNLLIEAIRPLTFADAVIRDINVVYDLEPIPDLKLDGNEIRQMILNLTRNALEAMTSGKTLFIRTFCEANQVILEIKDQGGGIDSSIIDKIGTPFITTKTNGTGLGLAVCYRIAARYHATIRYETSKEGTVFFIHFSIDPHE